MNPTLSIGDRQIGLDHRPYVIAEAGVHHFNSLEIAKAYVVAARIAGADAIKFQTYSAGKLVTTWAPTYWDDPASNKQFDIFASRSLLKESDYRELFAVAREVGIELLSTPFDEGAAVMLHSFGMAAHKIASADLTHFPLLEKVASLGKPVLLSTGAADYDEVRASVEFLRPRAAAVGVLHCVLSYPTPVKDANLNRILVLREMFPDLVVGYSDHTQPSQSNLACPLAVALGARVIEKHFTLNRLDDGDDHYHAVDADGLKRLVRDCKDAFAMSSQADAMKASEGPARMHARRSIVAARPIAKGTVLALEHLDFKRPGTGLAPTKVADVVGKRARIDIEADALILLENLD